MNILLNRCKGILTNPAYVIAVFSTAVILAILIADLWGIRFTTHDDTKWPLTSSIFAYTEGLATGQGRIYFLFHSPIVLAATVFYETAAYDFIQYGSFVLSCALLGVVLWIYVSPAFGLVFSIAYAATMALIWEHTLLTSVPLFHYMMISIICLSILLLWRYRVMGNLIWLVASIFMFFTSFWGQEFYVVITTMVFVAAIFRLDTMLPEGRGISLKRLTSTAMILSGGYITLMLGWRLYYGTAYDGSEVALSNFDFTNFFGVVLHWSISGNAFYWRAVPYVTQYIDFQGNIYHHIIRNDIYNLMAALTVAGFFKVAATMAGSAAAVSGKRESVITGRSLIVLSVIALTIAFSPSTLLGLTSKYQQWFAQGARAFTYTSISHVGVVLLATTIFFKLRESWRFPAWRWITSLALVLVLGFGSLLSAHHNRQVARTMHNNDSRWDAFHLVYNSPKMSQFLEGKTVIAPRLWSFSWSVPTGPKEYWTRLTEHRYGKKTLIVNSFKDIPNLSTLDQSTLLYLDFFQIEETGQTVVLVADLSLNNGMSASNVQLISDRDIDGMLIGRAKNGQDIRIPLTGKNASWDGTAWVSQIDIPPAEPHTLLVDDRVFWLPLASLWPSYVFGSTINFSDRGNSGNYKVKGWSNPEAKHTWSVGKESSLAIATAKPACDRVLMKAEIGPFYIKEKMKPPQLSVFVNDIQVWSGTQSNTKILNVTVPTEIWAKNTPVQIRFAHPNAVSPLSIGASGDGRVLAFGFNDITFEDCPGDAAPAVSGSSPNYSFNTPARFATGGNAQLYMKDGWGVPEIAHTWSVGTESALELITDAPSCDPRLEMSVWPFYVADKMEPQRLSVLVNGTLVGDAVLTEKKNLTFDIPLDLWTSQTPARISFRHPDSKSPKELGMSGDPRKLAIGFEELVVRNCATAGK